MGALVGIGVLLVLVSAVWGITMVVRSNRNQTHPRPLRPSRFQRISRWQYCLAVGVLGIVLITTGMLLIALRTVAIMVLLVLLLGAAVFGKLHARQRSRAGDGQRQLER